MKSPGNDYQDLSGNIDVRSKKYPDLYHDIAYFPNEERHIRTFRSSFKLKTNFSLKWVLIF